LDNVFLSYNDPLVSIFILLTLILSVSLLTHLFGNLKKEKQQKKLENFLETFESKDCSLNFDIIPFSSSLLQPLRLLALAFQKNGEYHKAIPLYLYLIKNNHEKSYHNEFLKELASTYLKSGLMARAKSTLISLLEISPRDTKALYLLQIIYEMLHQYKDANEISRSLKILGEDTTQLEAHFRFFEILNSKSFSPDEKTNLLIALNSTHKSFYRQVLHTLFKLDVSKAWAFIEDKRIIESLDILWTLPTSKINFDIIEKTENQTLKAIFMAREIIPYDKNIKSNIFEIDTILSAKNSGKNDIDIQFNYFCPSCKAEFPLAYNRCPSCYSIDKFILKKRLEQKIELENYSLL
jgi:lipopolysaccharide biosynthesis regulator YciM